MKNKTQVTPASGAFPFSMEEGELVVYTTLGPIHFGRKMVAPGQIEWVMTANFSRGAEGQTLVGRSFADDCAVLRAVYAYVVA